MDILKEVESLQPWMTQLRHTLHQWPELGSDLPKTAALVRSTLDELQIPWQEVSPCGTVALLGRDGGRRLLLRADMDALPIQEETEVPYASKRPGIMHACGHDCHTAMLLTAARILKKHEQELPGRVILMFQPDEEGTGGAKRMLDAGLLETYRPDAAVMTHMAVGKYHVGQLYLRRGAAQASCDQYKITITGVGGHGARPDEAVNPIICGVHLTQALGELGRFELNPFHPSALTVCSFQSGSAPNVIPADATLLGTLRTFDEAQRHSCLARMQALCDSLGQAFRCKVTLHLKDSTPSYPVHGQLAEAVHGWLEEDLGPGGVELLPFDDVQSMGSEDFAYIAQKVPACTVLVGGAGEETPSYPGHHPRFLCHDAGMIAGAAAYVDIALRFLQA